MTIPKTRSSKPTRAGLLDVKASQVAAMRLQSSPETNRINKHGQRTEGQHKAIRAAEVQWTRVRDAAGFKPAKSDPRANNAKKDDTPTPAPAPITLQSIVAPTVSDAGEALKWIGDLATKARSFRNIERETVRYVRR